MSKETIKPVITQKAAKDYSTLHIAYYINGEQVEPEPKKGSHYWFFRKGNTLHPWQNSAALFLYEISGYEALDRIDFLDFQREKVFERFIRFFQDKIEVTIEDPEIKPLEEADSEKQVYLQEHGEHILFFPVMLYGSSEVNLLHGTSDGLLYERRESETVQIKRDKEAEDEALQAIRETIPQFEYQQDHDYFFLTIKQMLEDNRFIKFYEKCRANHIRVFGFKELKSLKYHPAGASVSYSIKSNEDWFDMELSVSFDDHQVSLKDLRKAVVNHENLVPIGDGQYGILPDEFLKKFSSALKVGEIEEDNVKLQKSQFTVVHALLNQQSDVRIVEELSEKMQMLKSFDKIESVPVPQNLKATMRDYQKAGLSWLAFLARFNFGGCLADDMGLGKTVQMLAFFLHLKEKDGRKNPTHLVVCPTTLIFNWQNEIKKFAPSLKTFVYWGTQRQFDEKEMKKHDVVLTSYGTMVNDIELLHKFRFTTAVFDESQAMKNPSSLRFKAALLLQAQYRFSLTGTPIENNTIELFSQMHVLNKGLLGTFNTFRKTYGKNLEGDENAHLRQELRRIIYPFIIRRTKEKVAAELPEKSEIELYCEMGEHQQKVYEAFRQNYKEKLLKKIDEEGVNKARFNVLDGILKLRQICDSPALLNTKEYYGDDSAKADELIRYILEKTSNHKVLVFSQFVKMLTLIKNRLEKHNIVYTSLDGATRDREERVNYFQNNEECRVFLISLKAGGYGLNLTAADYVFLIDPWWNPAVESQAIDRTHRIGQAKKVFAYRMISKGTIEEKILKLQKRKKSLADEIITEESSFVKKLTAKDIEHLFS
jgi:non-specific serine/threonine protein kinase